MGATLPALARSVDITPRGVAWLGLFYGSNTLGAVFAWAIEGEGSRPRCPSFRLGLLAASAFVIDNADTYVDSWEVVDFIDTVRKANQDNFVIIFQDIVELKTQLQARADSCCS